MTMKKKIRQMIQTSTLMISMIYRTTLNLIIVYYRDWNWKKV